MSKKTIRIGGASASVIDRLEPAVALAREPSLDYLCFESLSEINVGVANFREATGRGPGYNLMLDERIRAVLPHCVENNITIVSNMGSAAPEDGADRVRELADELGVDITAAAVSGSDVLDTFDAFEGTPTFNDVDLDDYADAISADAYMGIDGILEALSHDADVVITGRVSDPALFLGPIVHEFGWQRDDPTDSDLIGQGLIAGHLLECAGQVTGGYFADPGYKQIDDLATLGFPIGEIHADGTLLITKLPDTGGQVTERTVKEQLLYEIHDPSEYVTPDGVVDFTGVTVDSVGTDRVRVSGGTASARPERYKVSIAAHDGFVGEARMGYAGPGAAERARLAGDIVRERVDKLDIACNDLRVDHVGIDSLHDDAGDRRTETPPYEVQARVAAHTPTERDARRVTRELMTLGVNGPAGGGATLNSSSVEPRVTVVSSFVDRDAVQHAVTLYDTTTGGERTRDRGNASAGEEVNPS